MSPDHEIVLRLLAETGSNGLEKFDCDYCLVEFSGPQLMALLDTSLRVTTWKELVPDLADVLLFPAHGVTFLGNGPNDGILALPEAQRNPPCRWDTELIGEVLAGVLDVIDGTPIQELLDEGQWAALPLSLEIPGYYEQRSEYERVLLDATGNIRWHGYPKHSDTQLDTPELHRDVIRDFLQELACPSKSVATSS